MEAPGQLPSLPSPKSGAGINANVLSLTNMDITRFAPELFNYNTQQMRYANTIVCNLMSVLLRDHIYFYIYI